MDSKTKLAPPKIKKLYPHETLKPRHDLEPLGSKTKLKAVTLPPPKPTLLQRHWTEYIHRVKVHELLRCLEAEQKKLQILREHTDLNDILLGINEDSRADAPDKILFMKSLEEEKKSAESLAEEVREAESDADYVSKSALKLFQTKLNITDKQFEQILELCKDRNEQKQLKDAFREKKNRERYLHNASERRRMLYEFINSTVFNRTMLFLIALSTAIIIVLTFEFIAIRGSYFLLMTDSVIIGIFLVEAGCKISIYKEDYFHNLWNILDLIIIITHTGDVSVDLITRILALDTDINKSLIFKLLKSLRSLRLLRAIKFLPNLQVIVSTIFQSMLSIGSIALLMMLFIFMFAVLGRGLFKDGDPIHFDNIGVAILTLFQLLTLDDWFDLLPEDEPLYIWKFIYLFFYIVIEYFVFLNLFVAVLVDNFQLALEEANYGEEIQSVDFSDARAIGLESEDEEGEHNNSWNSGEEHSHGLDLKTEDYFPIDKNSKECKLTGENMKLLTSIDFEYFMWLRRTRLTGIVLDTAVVSRQNTWNVHDIGV